MVNYEELFFKLLEEYLDIVFLVEEKTKGIFEELYEDMQKQDATSAEIIRYVKCKKN